GVDRHPREVEVAGPVVLATCVRAEDRDEPARGPRRDRLAQRILRAPVHAVSLLLDPWAGRGCRAQHCVSWGRRRPPRTLAAPPAVGDPRRAMQPPALTYCGNVHPSETLDGWLDATRDFAAPIAR